MEDVKRHFTLKEDQLEAQLRKEAREEMMEQHLLNQAQHELESTAEREMREKHPQAYEIFGRSVVPADVAHIARERLIGQNALRFVIQHFVQNETGLSHFFTPSVFMGLQARLDQKRLTLKQILENQHARLLKDIAKGAK